jgi:gliding motility-associated protein GldE
LDSFYLLTVILVLLLGFSGFLLGSRAAFRTLASGDRSDRNDAEEGSYIPDKKAERLIADPDRYIASVTVWNVFANVALIILAVYIGNFRFNLFSFTDWNTLWEVLLLAVIIVVFCEIIPAKYAQLSPVRFISRSAPLLNVLEILSRPLSSLMLKSAVKLNTGSKKRNNDVSVDELSKALELTSEELSEEKEMLQGIIGLYNKTAVEIMTPRPDIAYVRYSAGFNEVIDYIVKVAYSRIPVYGNNQDEIKGILYIKDLLPYLNQTNDFHWQKLIRPAFYVPESKKVDDLLEEFRTNKIHLAVVVDEFGGTSGIVTMEDILEEIVGDISDEYDEDEAEKCIQTPEGDYICDAKVLLNDFFKATGVDTKAFGKHTDEVDSLAGLVLEIKEGFPEEGETVHYDNYSFKVLEMDDKRILKIQFTAHE